MTRPFKRCLAALAILGVAACSQSPSAGARPDGGRQVILISVDGFTAQDYLHTEDEGLDLPNITALKVNGCPANGMTGIFPTVTYPSHTAMITGQPSAVHGVYTNTPLDPMGLQNGGWYYYADRIKTPTLWEVLHDAGLKTAAISWPVTIGADIDYLLPEYRPVRTEEDVALLSALSTPGMFREMIEVDSIDRPMTDPWRIKAAIRILDTRKPDLLALHISDLDGAQHSFGPHSAEAHAALEKIDQQIGELRAAVDAEGRTDQTSWVIVSDHGFYPVDKTVNPMIALRDAGLITTNAAGRVTDWKVFMHNEGGSAFLEARDPADTASINKAIDLMKQLAANPANGIERLYTPEELKELDAMPTAFIGMEAARGYGFGSDMQGATVTNMPRPGGKHGYNPAIPELRPTMILSGAGVVPCDLREGVRIVDVGPTVAGLLGTRMTDVSGKDVNTPIAP